MCCALCGEDTDEVEIEDHSTRIHVRVPLCVDCLVDNVEGVFNLLEAKIDRVIESGPPLGTLLN